MINKFYRTALLSVVLILIVAISILFFVQVFAEETESGQPATEEPAEGSTTKYEDAKGEAEKIVEDLNLADYLAKYFEEDVVSAIISAIVCVIAVVILMSGFIVFAIKMGNSIKNNGLTTSALKEIGNKFVTQTEEMKKAVAEMTNTVETLETKNTELMKGIEKIRAEFTEYKENIVNSLANDPTLTQNGTADKILVKKEDVEV